ncbi:flagellar hook basal-body protein [Rhodohalobacter sp. SW132]|uniref:flagellar hook-basal body protein n=1 Tax=Rhodohalobacter sp. SW132 TaxID=2293433 RepID=UPI000E24DF54|nr:flagellar hook basal-body protein [Rhodohalobacter sp. SW132]REL38657.1 flagellar hook basal-body protein [Rhodohalobacter sp. SW132]
MIDRFQAQMQAMQMLTRAQDNTADNLANINTPGYKGSKMFHRLITEQVDGRQVTKPVPMQQINLQQGVLEPTGNAFDFGIDGSGFFAVQEDGQTFLTRDGRFHIDSDGYLRNSQGANVIGSGGAVHIPEYFQAIGRDDGGAKLEVAKDGTIRLNDEVYDKLRIVDVNDPSNLERKGGNYFSAPPNSLVEVSGNSNVMQGFYEKGNVEPLSEMVDMMKNSQMFEAQQRAMRTTDETLAQATTTLGRF